MFQSSDYFVEYSQDMIITYVTSFVVCLTFMGNNEISAFKFGANLSQSIIWDEAAVTESNGDQSYLELVDFALPHEHVRDHNKKSTPVRGACGGDVCRTNSSSRAKSTDPGHSLSSKLRALQLLYQGLVNDGTHM